MKDRYNQGVLELAPGIKGKPAFKSPEEYEQFRLNFQKAVEPELRRYREARARSELAAMHHWVD